MDMLHWYRIKGGTMDKVVGKRKDMSVVCPWHRSCFGHGVHFQCTWAIAKPLDNQYKFEQFKEKPSCHIGTLREAIGYK